MFLPIYKSSMCAVWLAATPAITAPTDASVWAQWGLAGMVMAYVLWRDTDREKRNDTRSREERDRSEENSKWVRDTLLSALERNTKAIERSNKMEVKDD